MYTHIYVHTYIYIHMYIYVCVCIYIYISGVFVWSLPSKAVCTIVQMELHTCFCACSIQSLTSMLYLKSYKHALSKVLQACSI